MNAPLPVEMLEATSTKLAPTERAALALASSKTEAIRHAAKDER